MACRAEFATQQLSFGLLAKAQTPLTPQYYTALAQTTVQLKSSHLFRNGLGLRQYHGNMKKKHVGRGVSLPPGTWGLPLFGPISLLLRGTSL